MAIYDDENIINGTLRNLDEDAPDSAFDPCSAMADANIFGNDNKAEPFQPFFTREKWSDRERFINRRGTVIRTGLYLRDRANTWAEECKLQGEIDAIWKALDHPFLVATPTITETASDATVHYPDYDPTTGATSTVTMEIPGFTASSAGLMTPSFASSMSSTASSEASSAYSHAVSYASSAVSSESSMRSSQISSEASARSSADSLESSVRSSAVSSLNAKLRFYTVTGSDGTVQVTSSYNATTQTENFDLSVSREITSIYSSVASEVSSTADSVVSSARSFTVSEGNSVVASASSALSSAISSAVSSSISDFASENVILSSMNVVNSNQNIEITSLANRKDSVLAGFNISVSSAVNATNGTNWTITGPAGFDPSSLEASMASMNTRINNLSSSVAAINHFVTVLYNDLSGNHGYTGDMATGSLASNYGLAFGNINLFGSAADGAYFIRTNDGQTPNDITVGL